MGTVRTVRAFRHAKPLIFKGLKELFSCALLRKKVYFKQKLTAAVSVFLAGDIICLGGK